MSEYNKSKKTKKLVLILSAVGVVTLALGVGLGVGLNTSNDIKETVVRSGKTYDVVVNSLTNEKSVKLPEYSLEYTTNEYSLTGSPLFPGNLEATDYTNGKEGFFKFNYMNMGIVKLESDTKKIIGGWTAGTTVNDIPTRTTDATNNPDKYEFGAIDKGSIRFHLNKLLVSLKGTTTNPKPVFTTTVPNVKVKGDDTRYLCLLEDPQIVTAANDGAIPSAIGKYDFLLRTPDVVNGSVGEELDALPTNSDTHCFKTYPNGTTHDTSLPTIMIFYTYDGANYTDNMVIPSRSNRKHRVDTIGNMWETIRINHIGYFTHPVFGQIRVNNYNNYINPYTNKEEKLVLTNGKLVIPESYVSLSDFKVKEFQSKSFGASHSLKLNEKFYQLTKEQQASSEGLALKNEIIKTNRLNQTFCLPSTTTDLELAKYYDTTLLYRSKVTDEDNPLYSNKFLYSISIDHNISGFIKSNTIETIEMNCWSYKADGFGGDKYLTRLVNDRDREIEANKKPPTEEMNTKLIEDLRKYDLFCTLDVRKSDEAGRNSISITYGDSDKLAYFKKVYPSKTATTWDEVKSYLDNKRIWTPIVYSRFKMKETDDRKSTWDERYDCYDLVK